MENTTTEILMRILREALHGNVQNAEITDTCLIPETISQLYRLAKSHDLAHIVCEALENKKCLEGSEFSAKFQKQKAMATYRYAGIQYELESVCALLEEAKIAYMPLKGAVIRAYYPTPEMRTSSDIDILLHLEDLDRAAVLITQTLGYTQGAKTVYDISLFSPGGVHLELHFSLDEDDPSLDAILLTAWDTAVVEKNTEFHYRMSNEMFYIYTVAHMAKHFLHGGCGIRPLMDLWIIEHKMKYDKNTADDLLQSCHLTEFSQRSKELSEVWFSDMKHTRLTKSMEDYILGGGVYGISENKIAIASTQSGGRLRYALGRIFLPYRRLKVTYPVLNKYPVLYPFCLIRRWCRILFGKDRKNAIHEFKNTVSVEEMKKESLGDLCRELKLI